MNTDFNNHTDRLSSNNLFRIRWISSWVITNGIRWTDHHSRIRFKWRSELFQLFSSLRFQWSLLELFYPQVSFNDSQAFYPISGVLKLLPRIEVDQRPTSTPLNPRLKNSFKYLFRWIFLWSNNVYIILVILDGWIYTSCDSQWTRIC